MGTLMEDICELGDFIRRLRTKMRFGELSRAPLRLLRLQLRNDAVECEWMARAADPWDADLPASLRERHVSLQALQDAIAIRELLLSILPGIQTGVIRVYRQSEGETPELVIAGSVNREEQSAWRIPSLAMRAKLCGFQFCLENGVLEALERRPEVKHAGGERA